jgi:hypothetical protein
MSAPAPIKFRWLGDGFEPYSPFWQGKADEQFVVGEAYRLSVVAGRSEESHRHLFAVVDEAWGSLPDDLLDRYPTALHLRKAATVGIGYYNESLHVMDSPADAIRLAATFRSLNEYVVISVRKNVVRAWTAKSLSRAAIPDRKEWAAIKDKLLTWVGDLIGVTGTELDKHDGAST